jgi:hydroxymethylbilane synthase
LALAGLKRLGMNNLASSSEILTWDQMLPAVAQGAIGIQCRTDDKDIFAILEKLNDRKTQLAVECERSFLATLDGNCRTPIAAQAEISTEGVLHFKGMIVKCDGSETVAHSALPQVCESVEHARIIGHVAGLAIRVKAGEKKMKEFFDSMTSSPGASQ